MSKRSLMSVALVCIASVAAADDREEAKQRYDSGSRHYNLAEYDQAVTDWKESYRLSRAPLLLFNIGQAYRKANDCTQALTFYEAYAREVPDPENQHELDQAIAVCRAMPKPIPKPVPPAPQERASGSNSVRIAGVVVGSVGVVLGAAGGYFAYDGYRLNREAESAVRWSPALDADRDRGRRANTIAIACGSVGLAGIATGVALIIVGRRSAEQPVAVVPGRTGASVSWTLRF